MLCGVLNSIMGSQLLSKKGLRYTMEAIVAVYEDWGIGCCGTQPVALSVDRKFFREMTRGAMVIVGRRTVADFPGQKPLPGRYSCTHHRLRLHLPADAALLRQCAGDQGLLQPRLRYLFPQPG